MFPLLLLSLQACREETSTPTYGTTEAFLVTPQTSRLAWLSPDTTVPGRTFYTDLTLDPMVDPASVLDIEIGPEIVVLDYEPEETGFLLLVSVNPDQALGSTPVTLQRTSGPELLNTELQIIEQDPDDHDCP